MAKKTQTSKEWLKVLEDIKNSTKISESDKTKAINEIKRMADNPKTYTFNHNADDLISLFAFRTSPFGGEYWGEIEVKLKSKI